MSVYPRSSVPHNIEATWQVGSFENRTYLGPISFKYTNNSYKTHQNTNIVPSSRLMFMHNEETIRLF